MNNRPFLYSLLLAGMSLGTAWAIRGQFGHEQGAAWAGAIGGLSIVLLAKRPDWYAKAFQLTLASAAGWGIGGIISYGRVVGFAKGLDFGNVYYGLVMLFVIGGLFGLLGGGLFGLTLASSREKPVKWPQLLVEMTAGALIFYYLLIEEFGWLMTPPRSEAWAACFGMSVAMFWYMIRNKQSAAIRVAVFAGLGGGLGFAFGNFLQVLGIAAEIKFNFWNVMEYSIGFFGGIGMAYGTFTSEWPKSNETTQKKYALAPVIILAVLLPFVNWDQSFETERLIGIINNVDPLADAPALTRNIQWIALLLVFVFGGYWIYIYSKLKEGEIAFDYSFLTRFFFAYLGFYALLSILITCAFMSIYRLGQYLYIINAVIIGAFIKNYQPSFSDRCLNFNRWAVNLVFVLMFFAILTAVAVSSHGELNGAQVRFE